jgi:hypothetical protein
MSALLSALLFVLLCSAFCVPRSAFATTPFSYQFFNSDGTPQTNRISMEAWPRSTNQWTVYGTNIIYGSKVITLDPDATGYGTNYAFPNTYRLFMSNLNSGFFISLPDTTNQIALGTCLTDAPQVAGPIGFYGMVTNWLGFAPPTNSVASISNLLNFASLRSALAFQPVTNDLASLTNLLTSTALIGELGYTPMASNSVDVVTALGFQPATNSLASITNLLTPAAILGELAFQPATNGILPDIVTNMTTGIGFAFTNLALGSSPSHAMPNGSIIQGTNGNVYVRTNGAWINLK